MHPKDPIPDAQKMDIIYHWKCPANTCMEERVSDHQCHQKPPHLHKTPKTPKSRRSKRSTSHSYQDPSTQYKQWQSQNPFSIQQTLKPPTQLELPHSSIPYPRGEPSSLGLSTQKTINTSHLLDLHLQ